MAQAKLHALEGVDDFNEHLEKSEAFLLVIDCHQHWCGPCETIKPTREPERSSRPSVPALRRPYARATPAF